MNWCGNKMYTELCKTELMNSVIIRIYYKYENPYYKYYIDINSVNQHQKSWGREFNKSIDPPDSEILEYCFFIHSKVIKHIHKNLKKKTSNLLKKTQYRKLYDAQEGRCYLCGEEMTVYDCSIDHVVPVSKGGKDKMSNKLLAHGICNSEKADRIPTKNEIELMSDIHSKAKSLIYHKILK